MSAFSFVRQKYFEDKDFYPFFYWKLYTKPTGCMYSYKDYRLYGVTEKLDTFRINNKGYSLFDKDDYFYFIQGEAQSVLKNKRDSIHIVNRIKIFAKALGFNSKEYLIVEEEFNPLDIVRNPNAYKVKVIFSAKND
ncbi:hypothetical protein FHR24_000082 [Wenyingzhuangia heitensis]|uniref:Uncharacterized protein n=1 Tax=Wenyingzhuangia heitensis TaxID=1487859 RepID=A0ABX0U4D4_9FLAO|nr:hypothetical protein [Wenyingzhuangia heitensis]NIJ43643.1 hypothetical protein [Wenyingzhuangia heitensis]